MKSSRASAVLCLFVLGHIFTTRGQEHSEPETSLHREKNALLDFKRGLRDPRGILKLWTRDSDPCNDAWPGVVCSRTRRVQEIYLPNFDLEGTLPDFADLIALKSVRMPNNSLMGPLPEAWSALPLLETVDLRGNQINGSLPNSWYILPSLQYIYLNDNRMEGALPVEWWLGNFKVIALAGNRFEGILPVNWKNMEDVEVLDLSHNRLTGILPPQWSALSHLKRLFLDGNGLYGPLPAAWREMEAIEDLRLGSNNLVGELPSSWSFMFSATAISLEGNNLGGHIPEEWATLSQACRIDVSNNPFVCSRLPEDALLAKREGPGLVIEGASTGHCPTPGSLDTQALLQFKAEILHANKEEALEDWDWKGNSACGDGWSGIRCLDGRVVEIDLSSFGLSGYLSEKLSQMTALEEIKLDNNGFEGKLPEAWTEIKSLKHLNLSGNSIGGILPREWEGLERLQSLDLSYNRLFGELPSQWNALTNLRVLKASDNTLEGQLPYSWSTLRDLIHLELQNNILAGSLPVTWKTFENLNAIDFSNNRLIGPVPETWSNLTQLRELNLQGNPNLCGGVPSSLSDATNQQGTSLSEPCNDRVREAILLVNFRSEIEDTSESLSLWKADTQPCSEEFEKWPGVSCEDGYIVGLDLRGFQLSGALPDTLSRFSRLEHIHVGENYFSGTLPLSWSSLLRLQQLNVSYNRLSGSLPAEWRALSSLVLLDLSGNNFEGTLPSDWSRMVELESLNVSDNVQLCGGLPKELSERLTVIHDNSTFFESCNSARDNSMTYSILLILLSAFILMSLLIWISCFCCCCYQRKRQRSKLLEMMSTSVSKSREAHNNEMHAHTGTNLEGLTDHGASSSSRSGRSLNSPHHRFPVGNELPPLAAHVPRTVHPYYSHGRGTDLSSWSQEHLGQRRSRSRSPLPVAEEAQMQIPTSPRSATAYLAQRPAAFGSMQNVPPSGSLDGSTARRPNTPPHLVCPRSQSRLEMCRTLMHQPATPSENQALVQRVRAENKSPVSVLDPRQRESRIPRYPTPSVASSTRTGSARSRSSSNRRPPSREQASGQGTTFSASSDHAPQASDSARSEQSRATDRSVESGSTSQKAHDTRWKVETSVELPATPRDVDASSPTAEMFRWLESCYQSGTFDLEDVPRQLRGRVAQQSASPAVANNSFLPPRYASTPASVGMQSSTKELLMWLESRIEEERSTELSRVRGRLHPARADWAPVDSNDAPLFNYKTTSSIDDDA